MTACHIKIFYSDEDGGYIADIPVRGILVGSVTMAKLKGFLGELGYG
jgi:hypothetical protein